jgi:LacI family transcriptional regulator, galactose operon repressor
MDKPKLRDVAVRAGVHPSTASRALNPETRYLVKGSTLRRVDAAAASLGYQTDAIARSLRTRRTSTVGVLIPDLTNPVFPPTVRGIEDGLGEAGYTVLLANTDNDRVRERRQLEALGSRQVDGLVVATADHAQPANALTVPTGLPLVLLYDLIDGVEAHSVVIDDAAGTRKAVAHLRALGHQEIAYLAGPQHRSPAVERLSAFRQAMGDGLRDELVRECESFAEDDAAAAFGELLDSGPAFTAVVAASDQLALGVYDVLAARGLSCPGDCSVVGFHDVPFMDKLRPGLTTVHVPHHQAGVEAARLLLGQLRNPSSPPVQVRVPVRLVERGSTAQPAAR